MLRIQERPLMDGNKTGESSDTDLADKEEGALLLYVGDGSLNFCGRTWTVT
jgi:hypothetical protein